MAENIENFEIIRSIGKGATAEIFLARNKTNDKIVSLKKFHPQLITDKGFCQRIQRESKIASSLHHPNIVSVYEMIETPPCLVMEYVDGQNLEVFQSRLPYVLPEVSVLITIEILKALSYAHQKKLIHRDLKPENILIRFDGSVFVTDFGLAKNLGSTQITQINSLLGTLDYMSPEQASGEVLTEASDLFSVGAILYFLITGTRPFARNSSAATISAVKECLIEPPQKRNPKVSTSLSRIVLKALQKNKEDRFQTAEEFLESLLAYLQTAGLSVGFELGLWIQSSAAVTYEALRISSDHLAIQAEAALKNKKWDLFLGSLSHLSLKAPQSASFSRLSEEYRKRKGKKRHVLSFAIPTVVVMLIVSGFYLVQNKKKAPQQPSSVVVSPTKLIEGSVEAKGIVVFRVSPKTVVLWDGKKIDPAIPLDNQTYGDHELILRKKGFMDIKTKVTISSQKPIVVNAQ